MPPVAVGASETVLRPPGQVTAAAGGLGRQPVLSQEEDVGWESSPEVHKPPAVSWSCSLWPARPTPAPWGHPAPRPGAWRLSLPSCYPGLPSPGPAPRPPGGPTWPSSCSPQLCPAPSCLLRSTHRATKQQAGEGGKGPNRPAANQHSESGKSIHTCKGRTSYSVDQGQSALGIS